ncbi:DNA-3-methyladenine glycosylase family protein [Nakamurella leprariae]|uniref:DNA-3-methyladenine glycosylase 2 family protein n=1 Tax=Nakamurella leprariae TaxID=2803911 RepID=A0A938Y9U7_9ACTN|nr:DNA-3-methyladenine glycosylase 2 family protein [Nakamurella leprariae]
MTSTWTPAEPVDLISTLAPLRRGTGDPTLRFEGDRVWRVSRTPLGSATLHLVPTVGGGVRATAWGDGAEWMISQVPELLGHGDDWTGFDCSGHRLLHDSRRRNPGLRLPRTGLVFETMVPTVIEQKVTGKEARFAYRHLVRQFGEPPPGPAPDRMVVPPSPEQWRRIPSWEWHRVNVDPSRSRTVLATARVADSLDRTVRWGRGGPRVVAALQSVPGVGPWTAAEVVQRAHGDPDHVSVGDYHLAAYVGWALIGRPVDDDGMLELLEPWAGHRHRIVRLIEVSGFRKPRFGPRMTIQDHRAH